MVVHQQRSAPLIAHRMFFSSTQINVSITRTGISKGNVRVRAGICIRYCMGPRKISGLYPEAEENIFSKKRPYFPRILIFSEAEGYNPHAISDLSGDAGACGEMR